MTERRQPVVTGVNKKGELLWGFIDMPRWQMEMFRVRYYGDFMAHWIKQQFFNATGFESDKEISSMELRSRSGYGKNKRRVHPGD
jgi:hypothetical protein